MERVEAHTQVLRVRRPYRQESQEEDQLACDLHRKALLFANAFKTGCATAAASRPRPCARNTTTAISGFSAGAYPTKKPCVCCVLRATDVPVFPAMFILSTQAAAAMPKAP